MRKVILALAAPLLLNFTVAWANELPVADKVLVKKSEKKLYLLREGQPFREYQIVMGKNPQGHKQKSGDERTPEGHYVLDWRNPESNFYKSIHISYPNEQDQANAAQQGVNPGGMIMIHGLPNEFSTEVWERILKGWDWTDGCIAVNNREMDEIWLAVRDGTPIEILP